MRNKMFFLLLPFCSASITLTAQTTTYEYTGSEQLYKVPDDVCFLEVDVVGASGSPDGGGLGIPGKGGRVAGILPVIPGTTLLIYVGGEGTDSTGGFNGGAHGGDASAAGGPLGGGGGGASDIRLDTLRLVVAGGGGGCGGYTGISGGDGGDLSAADGENGAGFGGQGGSQISGGAGGAQAGFCGLDGASGSWKLGGKGGDVTCGNGFGAGGGGGGGYYGGGGGGGAANLACCPDWSGGGGGGSSYTDTSVINVVHTPGYQAGNGTITITPVICTGISGNTIHYDLKIFPNPFHETITVFGAGINFSEWLIMNMMGEKIYSGRITSEKIEINTTNLPCGVYFFQIISSNTTITKKIVKK
jgi:hypothetical protein